MPVERFRTFEEAKEALWMLQPDDTYFRQLSVLWRFANRLSPVKFPRGVFKFKTIEEANEHRLAWELEQGKKFIARIHKSWDFSWHFERLERTKRSTNLNAWTVSSCKILSNKNRRNAHNLHLQIINPLEYPGWDELLLGTDGYSLFHSSSWARVLHESYRYKPLYFTCIENGKLSALIPMMEVISFLTGRRGVSLPFTDCCQP